MLGAQALEMLGAQALVMLGAQALGMLGAQAILSSDTKQVHVRNRLQVKNPG